MTVYTDIANSALTKLGVAEISASSDTNAQGTAVAEQYNKLRDDLIRSHPWNFATGRAQLSRDTSLTPNSEFDNTFILPDDFMRMLQVWDNDGGWGTIDYRIEILSSTTGEYLVSSAADIYIKYIRQIEDLSLAPVMFQETMAYMLARELAPALRTSRSLHELMDQRFKESMRRARSIDAIEDGRDEFPVASWVGDRG